MHVPTRRNEATRDYLRLFEDVKSDWKKATQRLLHFLLHPEIRWEGGVATGRQNTGNGWDRCRRAPAWRTGEIAEIANSGTVSEHHFLSEDATMATFTVMNDNYFSRRFDIDSLHRILYM